MAFRIERAETAFQLSHTKQKRPRKQAPSHLDFIRSLPCAVCGTRRNIHAAHIRMAATQFGKRQVGIAEKPDDAWTVPLCVGHHTSGDEAQHNGSEEAFWKKHGIDPFVLALALSRASGDEEAGEIILSMLRRGEPG